MALKRSRKRPPDRTAAPDLLPVLGRGKHRDPSRGACFLEYTSLLAGEPFSDEPACVDRELAAILRQANDRLSDADRSRLVPLLGRAVGLVVPPPAAVQDWTSQPELTAGQLDQLLAAFARTTAAVHRGVSARFMAALGVVPGPALLRRFDRGRDLRQLFWHLMERPTRPATPTARVDRLLDRLVLLHECFELELGRAPEGRAAVPHPAPGGEPPVGAPTGR
jgi:hypothetical protein